MEDRPLQFIRLSADGKKFEVVEETAIALSKIVNPVVVISVAGMFRTGKSYLLNRYTLLLCYLYIVHLFLSEKSSYSTCSALFSLSYADSTKYKQDLI